MRLSTALKNFGLLFLVLLVIVFATGCSILNHATDKAAEKIADGVERYCAELDPLVRENIRNNINSRLDGQNILVTCKGD